jgi:2-oxoglutarate dehydrogenase E1 component
MTTPNFSSVSSPENLAFLEELYDQFRARPDSVPADYRSYFEALGKAPAALSGGAGPSIAAAVSSAPSEVKELRLLQLVEAYRQFGHREASLDPLSGAPAPIPELDYRRFGFSEADLDTSFDVDGLFGEQRITLRELIARLRETYCRFIGVEFMHIDVDDMQRWLASRMEASRNRRALSRDEQIRMLERLTDAEVFEQYLHLKFLEDKRFSLEGGETLIPLIDRVIDGSSALGVDDIVIGMAHRGRLNVLANVLGKPVAEIFRGFMKLADDAHEYLGAGDVKYHLGHSADYVTQAGKKVHISLAFNPSHLEAIYPVVEGRVRARQDRMGDSARERSLALVIHGDAAFPGQGVVAEVLNFSELSGYTTGGTVHVIVNNQVGFTTNPQESRSSRYATGLAKMLDIPILHVNGEDPESVAHVVSLAVEFRHRFKRDVVIDMYCYRKYGHNEQDEPRFTQPVMYEKIKQRPTVRESYVASLVTAGLVTKEETQQIAARRKADLEKQHEAVKAGQYAKVDILGELWMKYRGGRDADTPDAHTGITLEKVRDLGERLVTWPSDFQPLPKLVNMVLNQRKQMAQGEKPADWGFAENLAFASLLTEGHRVRLSGQDTARGTFSHRHAVFYDVRDGRAYSPLQNLAPMQAPFEVVNSSLSEFGVLGFDYGYSLDSPDALVIWEAQFGDFVNGAQVILDQFLSSAEDKWKRLSGLVVLLPHGFEGQGPEHSSARLERFLNMAAEDNWQICNLTTPAQYFHALRRQIVRPIRKPLVIMTPKSLLRRMQSPLEEFTGDFKRVIGDSTVDPSRVRRALLCSGKVFYDLNAKREKEGITDTAIIRIEQLYPYPQAEIVAELTKYPKLEKLTWVQEEPWNMGAWFYLRAREHTAGGGLPLPLTCVSRAETASPATGHPKAHEYEQNKLLDEAFQDITQPRTSEPKGSSASDQQLRMVK